MSLLHRTILLLACIALCSTALFSLRNATAAFLAITADNLLNDAKFSTQLNDVAVIEQATARLSDAIKIRPEWPDYWQWRGRLDTLNYLAVLHMGRVPDGLFLRQALVNYRAVIREKTLWSYGYLDLAYNKFLLGEIDDEFYSAFKQVFEQGRESYRVCRTLSLMGLRLWMPLRIEYRDMVRESFLVTYRQDRWNAMLMARDANQVGITCLWVHDEPKKHPLCERPSSKWW